MVNPFDDSLERWEQVASEEKQDIGHTLSTFAAGLGVIGLGMAIFRARQGGNLIADLLHYAQHGRNQGRGVGTIVKHLANLGESSARSGGSAGRNSVLDAWIDITSGELRLDDFDLVKDIWRMEEVHTSGVGAEVYSALTERFKEFINRKHEGHNIVSFFRHNLERLTIGEVLSDQRTWSKRIGSRSWKTLERAVDRGWISPEHALDPRVFKDRAGMIKDTRVRESLRDFFTVIDPFGQGRVARSLIGEGPGVAVLPPKPGTTFQRYFIGDEVLGAYKTEEGSIGLLTLERGVKLRVAGDPLQVMSRLRQGLARVEEPKKGPLLAAQKFFGVGPAYATRRPMASTFLVDPVRRARALETGSGVLYKRRYKYQTGPSKLLGSTPIGAAVPEAFDDFGRAKVAIPGGGVEAKIQDLNLWGRLKVLFGVHPDYEVLKKTSWQEHKYKGSILTESDKYIPRPTGGIRDVDEFWPPGAKVSEAFGEKTITGAGDITARARSKFYTAKAGAIATSLDFANYLLYRVNALASVSLAGIGFKPSSNLGVNAARLALIPVAYKTMLETLGYADFLAEDVTGVSPVKAAATVYTNLRVAQQKLREATGIQPLASALERNYPGAADSELATAFRSVALPLLGFMTGLKGGVKAGLGRAGILYALFGGPAISQPSAELAEEYAGERKVPVRRGALWGFGYQPFFGGDVSHYEYSWYHQLRSEARTKSIYGSRAEYYSQHTNVFGIPFPTPHSLFGLRQIINPYALEEKHYYDRPYMETAGRFDEFPVFGPALSWIDEHIPIIGKPRRKMHAGELMGIPTISGTLADRTVPANASIRLGIEDLPASALTYEDVSDPLVRLRQQAAIATEPLGIYKFAMQMFGLRLEAIAPGQAASASAIGSTAREFYDMNLGGLFGQTEFMRRFLMSELGLAARQRTLFNPLRNIMPTWLPGIGSEIKSDEDYFLDFLHGDPYAKLEAGETRLPGVGYEAARELHSGVKGVYDDVDRLLILADVAPYSQSFLKAKERVDVESLDETWRRRVSIALQQRDVVVNNLFQYPRYGELEGDRGEIGGLEGILTRATDIGPARQAWDVFTHDFLAEVPYFGSKFAPFRSALERYQKEQIYGDTFADWQRPYETILRPAAYDVARSSPLMAAMKGAVIGLGMSSPMSRYLNPFTPLRSSTLAVPTMAIAATAASVTTSAVAGDNFIPPHKQMEIDAAEYMDKLIYMKARSYQLAAEDIGDKQLSSGYQRMAEKTLQGAMDYQDIRSAMSSPDRKYFDSFLNVPVHRRAEVSAGLPTYYAEALRKVWENDFENLGENDTEALDYFNTHALPSPDSLMWHPSVPSSAMKIKMIQGGVNGVSDNLHRFGFYDSQATEANQRFPDVHYQSPSVLNLPNYHSVKNMVLAQMRKLNPFDTDVDRTNIRKIHGSHFNHRVHLEHKIDRSDQTYFYMADVLR